MTVMSQLDMVKALIKTAGPDATNDQLVPSHTNEHPAIADVVAAEILNYKEWGACQVSKDVMARKRMGMEKYGTPLQPFNSRNSHIDLYQELIDALKYARVLVYETQHDGLAPAEYINLYASLQKLTIAALSLKERDKRGREGNKGS